jgi:hypothetical protein
MMALIYLLISTLLSANLLLGEEFEQPKQNRLGTHLNFLFGGHISAFYERRINKIFAIEAGAVGGEDFIAYGYSKLIHGGAFFGTNLYLTNVDAHHHLYFSPSLAITYGEASISNLKKRDWEHFDAIAFSGSTYFIYRYLFSFGLGVETGIGADIVSVLFPLSSDKSISTFSFPIPKIELGLSYSF